MPSSNSGLGMGYSLFLVFEQDLLILLDCQKTRIARSVCHLMPSWLVAVDDAMVLPKLAKSYNFIESELQVYKPD